MSRVLRAVHSCFPVDIWGWCWSSHGPQHYDSTTFPLTLLHPSQCLRERVREETDGGEEKKEGGRRRWRRKDLEELEGRRERDDPSKSWGVYFLTPSSFQCLPALFWLASLQFSKNHTDTITLGGNLKRPTGEPVLKKIRFLFPLCLPILNLHSVPHFRQKEAFETYFRETQRLEQS